MKLRFLGGRYQGRIIDLIPAGFSVGRGKGNDLVLDEEGVSRHHCKFYELGGKWVVEDLNSTNGVRVNGKRISAARELVSGDRVGIHRDLLLFTDGSDIVQPPAAPAPAPAPPPEEEKDDASRPLPPSEVTEVKDEEEGDRPEEEPPVHVPWGRVGLLVVTVAVVIWLATHLLSPPETPPEAADPEPDQQEQAAAPDTDDDTPPPVKTGTGELTDDDLANLMAGQPEDNGADEDVAPDDPAPVPAPPPDELDPEPDPEPDPPALVTPPPPQTGPAAVSVAFLRSEPAGATVVLDGETVGSTPLLLRDLAAGRHRVLLQLDGYEDLPRQFHVPDVLPDTPYVLRQEPGTLRLTSEPAGATVWHGTQVIGRAPALLTGLAVGEYELRAVLPGFEPLKKTVSITRIRGEHVHFEPTPLLGNIEIVTMPAGCTISVDGYEKGITVPDDENPATSKPLLLRGFPEGDHAVTVEHTTGETRKGTVRVARGKTARREIKVTRGGRPVTGETDGPAAAPPGEAEPTVATPVPTDVPGLPEPAGPGDLLHVTAGQVVEQLKRVPPTELSKRYRGRNVVVTGVPTAVRPDAFGGCLIVGTRVRCFVTQAEFEQLREQADMAMHAKTPLNVTGKAVGIQNGSLVLRGCALHAKPEEDDAP